MHDYFDLLTDKVGTSYFISTEKDQFITNAQLEYVKRLMPSNEGGVVNLELDQLILNNIYTLIYETGTLNPTSSGLIAKTTVQTALNTASGSTDPFIYVMGVSWTSGGSTVPVKFTRHNDWAATILNTFTQGTNTEPRYKQSAPSFTFSPVNQTASVVFTLLKQPKPVSLSTPTSSELPPHTHKTIVELAVELASTSIRDQELNQLNSTQLNK